MSNAEVKPASNCELEYIGAGRSARVFRGTFADGTPFAQKIFTGEGTSRLVLKILTGAENPYRWCRFAMQSAVARRALLDGLTEYWLGDKLRLPKLFDWGWNAQAKAFQFRTELIQGCHAPLHDPLNPQSPDLFAELEQSIMQPLQQNLREAGFDGLLWQAGLGNPVAANNFMLERIGQSHRWVWIDMESGVPALFALDIRQTLRYYLPKSVKHGHALFDDVDLQQLSGYLANHREPITAALGKHGWQSLQQSLEQLTEAQQQWHALNRRTRRRCAQQQLAQTPGKKKQAWLASRVASWQRRGALSDAQASALCAYGRHDSWTQLLRWHRQSGSKALPRFLLADFAVTVGRNVPIWGGLDSALEHRCLRLAQKLDHQLLQRWPDRMEKKPTHFTAAPQQIN